MSDTLNMPSSVAATSLSALMAQGHELTELWNSTPVPERPMSEEALDVFYSLGLSALQAGQYVDAQVAFAVLLQHLPAHVDYLAGMGHALNGHGDPAGAVMMHALALQSAALECKTPYALSLAQAFIDVRQPQAAQAVLAALPSAALQLPQFKHIHAQAQAIQALIDRAAH
jgi:predicted Zn-dependent protease